jgi:hypothetical protein
VRGEYNAARSSRASDEISHADVSARLSPGLSFVGGFLVSPKVDAPTVGSETPRARMYRRGVLCALPRRSGVSIG